MRLGETDRFLVPRNDPRTITYFAERLYVAHGFRQRLLWNALNIAGARLAPRFLFDRFWTLEDGNLTPDPKIGVAAAKAADRRWRGAAALLDTLPSDGGKTASSSTFREWDRAILLRDYESGQRNRLVVFPFVGTEPRPRSILKIRCVGNPGPSLHQEWEALRHLTEHLPPNLAEKVPEPLAYLANSQTEILLMSHLPGSSAYAHLQNDLRPGRRAPQHFRAAAEWLADFHLATSVSGRSYVPGAGERALADRAAESDRGDTTWFANLTRLCERRPPVLAATHGDFWSRNLLLDASNASGGHPGRAAVVDWEHFEPEAPPWEDLFHFPVTYGMDYPWRRYRRLPISEAFRRTFLAESPVSLQVRRYLRCYTERTGLDERLLKPFLRLYLARKAHREPDERRPQWIECARRLAAAPDNTLRARS